MSTYERRANLAQVRGEGKESEALKTKSGRILPCRPGLPLSSPATRSAKGHKGEQGCRGPEDGKPYDGGGLLLIQDKTDKAQNQAERRSHENSQPAKG